MKKPQTLSLQEQLLNSGLATNNKAKQVKADKRKQTKLQRNQGVEIVDAIKQELEQSRIQQAERDRELNQLRKNAEEQKALQAQIKQLVMQYRIAQDEDGIIYKFNHLNKVKTITVTDHIRLSLIEGRSGIVFIENNYEIVPAEIILKIQTRTPDCVVLFNLDKPRAADDDDPYAAFQIPDDLVW